MNDFSFASTNSVVSAAHGLRVVGHLSSSKDLSLGEGVFSLSSLCAQLKSVSNANHVVVRLADCDDDFKDGFEYVVFFALSGAVKVLACQHPSTFETAILESSNTASYLNELGVESFGVEVESIDDSLVNQAMEQYKDDLVNADYHAALARGDERAVKAIDQLDYERMLWGQFP